jgi:hypothetical protein
MAYNNDQNEYPLPAGKDNNRSSAELLPRYFRSDSNKKFLGSTLDQYTTPGVVEKINAFVGRRESKATTVDDTYLPDVSADRENYQLEPSLVVKDNIGNVTFYKDYNDYIGQLNAFRSTTSNHSLLNSQEYYAWNPHINFDKFTNFREYYWLPNGPQEVPVKGQSKEIVSTYQVTLVEDDDNFAYLFTPNGLTRNPSLKLYRGQTYRFEVNTPGHPISIATSRAFQPAVDNIDSSLITTLYEDGITIISDDTETLVNRSDFIADGFVENGVLEFTIPENAPDTLYYISQYDINTSGAFNVYDIEEASEIDVENEILGKKTYTTSAGWKFTNGLKVYFQGFVTPATYAEGLYYVEGVGEGITLVPVNNLEVPAIFTQDTLVPFDQYGFDRVPFGDALSFAGSKDYMCINRADSSRNAWARYNRWFHKDIIETSAAINNQPVEIDESARAKRPIIEFDAGLRLYNHGVNAKDNVDLVDTFTADVFSTIEGSSGYNVDGVDLVQGMRVLFTADSDSFVNGKIFQVSFITHNNNYQISLIETTDSTPTEDDTVLVKSGVKNAGRMYWYNGTEWKIAQDKTGLNQAPKFDLYDSNGYSIGDETYYPSNNFSGNRVFSYRVGSGSNDTELGFPLSYKNINNVGDIVFDFDLLLKKYEYEENNVILNVNSDELFLRKYNNGNLLYANAWTKAPQKSKQYVIRKFTGEDSLNLFPVDVFNNSANLQDLKVNVYLNNKYLLESVDWNYVNVNAVRYVQFVNDIASTDIVVLKCFSNSPKNANGYYEIPHNLERNPLNNNITEFTLGQVNDHVEGLVAELDDYVGTQPGIGNLRDLGSVNRYGQKFVQHSGPINLALYHLTNKDANIIKAVRFAKNEYGKFKREFLAEAKNSGYVGNVKDHVDAILLELTKNKTQSMPFYSTDMLAFGGAKKLEYTVLDYRNTFYALSTAFDITKLSTKAVYVYVNNLQLSYEHDYTFTTEGFVNISATLANGDVVEIYEYENTEGSFIPQTPTKLGLYPKFEPKKFVDSSYTQNTNVIRGHDGSISVAYNDYRDDLLIELEKRIYNNLKVSYDSNIFDIYNFVQGDYRNTNLTKQQLDKVMITDFVNWLTLVGNEDYASNDFVTQGVPFSYNYSRSSGPTGTPLPGFWRAVYKNAYDTDRPHTHPWEMLGFSDQPTWWESVYGPAPYTSNNLILWQDIEQGITREPNKPVLRNKKFIRPNLLSHLPVDESGQLIDPLKSGYAKEFSFNVSKDVPFEFGDEAPVETAWRRSSDYAFSLLVAIILNRPNEVFAKGFDRSRISRNLCGNLIYNNKKSIRLQDIVFPNVKTSTGYNQTSGLVNYVADYMTSNLTSKFETYMSDLTNINNQIAFKLGGFADINKLRLVLDSRTPLNQGNVFIPYENYQIFLNTSSPRNVLNYSGIILEKTAKGYKVNGYNQEDPFFEYYPPLASSNDASINVGGISESFIEWNENKVLVAGKIVKYDNRYYRVNTGHTTGAEFESSNFSQLSELPISGGATALIRKRFENKISTINYGSILSSTQAVVDFLLGYEKLLIEKGFKFEFFNKQTEALEDFKLVTKEFLFWTTQNWATNSVIVLSPAANYLEFAADYHVVDNVFDNFYGYDVLKADTSKLNATNTNVSRDASNVFSISPARTQEGIYFAKLPIIQKEHVVIIDNSTVFNDTIYDPEPGYRQERIKVVGYRTDNWNGGLNIPGFVYDQATVTEWESYKDYYIGELIKYKEFYYSARFTHAGTENFENELWTVLPERPTSSLKPNWDYKTNQFTDFYDLDTDNFDTEQQRLAQHLIGYQKRQYLENIINDDVSQYKFYQGMIQDKGTNNVLTKLFDKLGSANQDSLNFYEEWAIRTGMYGATDSFSEVEYQLDERQFRLEPQTVELVNTVDSTRTDLVYQYPLKDVYLKTETYTHNPFITSNDFSEYTKTGGYVALDQINFFTRTLKDVLSLDINQVNVNSFIWVPEAQQSWNVYKHILSPVRIVQIDKTEIGFVATFNKAVPFGIGEIVGINNVNEDVNGFWVARKVNLNTVEFYSNTPITDDSIDLSDSTLGIISQLNSRRLPAITDANDVFVNYDLDSNERIWVDNNGNGISEVFDNNPVFNLQQELPNESGLVDEGYATAFSVNGSNQTLAVGLPDNGINGSVAVYSRISESQEYSLIQTITPEDIATQAIETISQTDPVAITTPVEHGLETGQQIKVSGATGLTDLNDNLYYINVLNDFEFEVYIDKALTTSLNGTGFSAHTFASGFISTGILYREGAGFGTSVCITENGQYLLVGAPYASDVKSRYIGEFDGTSAYNQGDIVSDRGTLWRAIQDIPAGVADSTISSLAQDWESIDILETDENGTISNLESQGVIHVYKKVVNAYRPLTTILSPVPQNNEQFGIAIKSAFSTENVHRLFVRSFADNGRIYFINSPLDNTDTFVYSKDRNYKGTFDPLKTYYTDEIVFAGNILYKANTNIFGSSGIIPGTDTEWQVLDQYIDYVGFIPNLGDVVEVDSDSVGLGNAINIGRSFDVSQNGNIIAIAGILDSNSENRVSIYRIDNNQRYIYESNIDATTLGEDFGYSVALSDDGNTLAVSAVTADDTGVDNGKVYLYQYNFNSENPLFDLSQELYSPAGQKNELFGWHIDFSKNKLAVLSINGDNEVTTEFDSNDTFFDNGSTELVDIIKDNGQVYVYQNINDTWVYAEKMRYTRDTNKAINPTLIIQDNHILVGMPSANYIDNTGAFTNVGFMIDFRSIKNANSWISNSLTQSYVDTSKIKNVFLYDKTTGDLVTYLDFIDPIQGKIAGPAEQELTYKLYYDPAVYNVGYTNTGNKTPWDSNYVGKLWWDLSTVKWFNTRQRNLEYKTNNWNKVIPSFEVDVYEWVETDLLPSEWNDIADTVEGEAEGVSGTSKYGDNTYVAAEVYDPITGTFANKYYYWVKNKRSIPEIENRKISSYDVTQLIADPAGQGYRFVAFYDSNKFGLHNVRNFIKNKDTILHIEWDLIETDNNVHFEYQLLTEGVETSKPTQDVVDKWIDSLVGYDKNSNPLPDISISIPRRYGILNSPNQSMFVNKTEALKQIVDRVNGVLSSNLIVDDFDISGLQKIDPLPSIYDNTYDIKVASENLLRFVPVAKIETATLQPTIVNGKITSVVITNSGRGYIDAAYVSGNTRKGPSVEIRGTGTGAVVQLYINNLGQVTSAEVIKQGKNYSSDTTIVVRPFTALVENDSNIGGFWALYNYNTTTRDWSRGKIQKYDTTLYWNYTDWYADGYDSNTAISYLIPGSYALESLNDNIGDVVKIENIGSGGWLLLEKIDDQSEVDYTVNYKTVGRQSGTIVLSSLLYQNSASGFDNQVFDAYLYDREPVDEIKNIMQSLQNDIFVDQLEVEWNKLFFASIRYALSEQVNIDWAFKTSFVKAKHNVGELSQRITFKNDNLSNYQDYVNEVKPYKTKVREYVSAYEKIEPTQTSVTDFDLQPRYDAASGKIVSEKTSVFDSQVYTFSEFVNTYPQKHWLDNLGFEISEIVVHNGGQGWTDGPVATISGGGGPTLTGKATLAGDVINFVDIDVRGARYITAPTVTFNGTQDETAQPATAVAILGNSKVRSTHMLMKFDRMSGNTVFTDLRVSPAETFVGDGGTTEVELKWAIDTRTSRVKVYVDGIELLSSEYTVRNDKDTSKGYTRYIGVVEFTTAPPINSAITVDYYRNASMLSAADRISYFYNPTTGMPGIPVKDDGTKDLSQVMDGIDYGGVQLDTLDFDNTRGFDTGLFGSAAFDTFDTAFDDEIFVLDGSTSIIDLAAPLEANVTYNVYFKSVAASASENPIRLDSESYPTANSNLPYAVIAPILGDGITTSIVLSDILEKYNEVTDRPYLGNQAGDTIIVRKSTSDGSTSPDYTTFDLELKGGNFEYTTAKGVDSGDIVVDGDGFVTPTTSKGPEEQVPGQVIDTLDIKVYNRVSDGQGIITVHNYKTDNETIEWAISALPQAQTSVIVKLDNVILDTAQYTIDWKTQTFTLEDSALLAPNKNLSIVLIDNNGTDIVDSDRITVTNNSILQETNIKYVDSYSLFVTKNGIVTNGSIVDNNGFVGIELTSAPLIGDVFDYTIYNSTVANFSQIILDETFVADGTKMWHEFDGATPLPYTKAPLANNILVQVNNKVLNPGYRKKFTLTAARAYDIDRWQFDDITQIYQRDILVYINNEKISQEFWQYDPTNGRIELLTTRVGQVGQTMEVYIVRDAEYTFMDTTVTFDSSTWTNNIPLGDEVVFSLTDDSTVVRGYVKSKSQNGTTVTLVLYGYIREFADLFSLDTTPNNVNAVASYGNDSTYFDVTLTGVEYSEGDTLAFVTPPRTGYNVKVYTFSNHDINEFERSSYNVVYSSSYAPEGSEFYFDKNLLTKGYIKLSQPAISANYVWVIKNGKLLTPEIDYILVDNKDAIQLNKKAAKSSKIEIIEFTAPISRPKYGFRIFKDMLNRYHFKRLNKDNEYTLNQPLRYYDTNIVLDDATGILEPNRNTGQPGIIWIDGERIEYYVKDGNLLRQLRRGTLGTGVKTEYSAGTQVIGQGPEETIPYKENTTVTDLSQYADGSTKEILLDFDVFATAYAYAEKLNITNLTDAEYEVFVSDIAASIIDVFVGGKRLRKGTPLEPTNKLKDTNYYQFNATIDQDSPDADEVIAPEYTVENLMINDESRTMLILNIQDDLHPDGNALLGEKLQVVRKTGNVWNDITSNTTSLSLADSNNKIAKFIREKTISLPR